MDNKEEFMKANGFTQDDDSLAWLNRTQRIWVGHKVVSGHLLSELTEKIVMHVPLAEFHFHSNRRLSDSFCIDILKRLDRPDLKPVDHVWDGD
jgi:hypothetical protein